MKNIWLCLAALPVIWSCNFKKIDAPTAVRFEKTLDFGDYRYYYPKDIIATPDKGSVIVGFSDSNDQHQAFLVRLTESGDVLWGVQNLGGPKTEARAVTATADAGFLVCGWTLAQNQGSDQQIWMAKFDASGNFTQHVFGSPNRTETAFGIVPVSNGNYCIGFSAVTAGIASIRLLFVDGTSGDSLNDVPVNTAKAFPPADMIATADGNIALTGVDFATSKTILLKINETGQVLTPSPNCPANSFGQALAELPDNSLVVAGYAAANNGDFFLTAYSSTGLARWTTPPQFSVGNNDDALWSVCATRDSQLLVLGYTLSYSGSPELYWSKRSAADGNRIWPDDWHYKPANRLSVIGGAVSPCADNGFILCATMENSPGTLLLLKIDAEGEYHKPI